MINLLNKKDERNIIYVLDLLLRVSIDGESIAKARNVDLEFYNLLNRSEVNQKIFHGDCLPASRENKSVDSEFANFIEKLSLFIEYDVNTDFVWAKVAEDDHAKKEIHQKITLLKKELLNYLLNKKVVSIEEYSEMQNENVKDLN